MKRIFILAFCAVCGLTANAGEPYRGLPDGYQQVESLHSPGGKPIALGVNSSADTTAELDYAPYTSNGDGDFGQMGGSDGDDYRLCPYSGGTFFDMGGRAGQKSSIHQWTQKNRQKIWMGAIDGHPAFKVWNTDGSLAAETVSSLAVKVGNYELAAFGATRASGQYYSYEMTVWSLRIWEAGTLVGDYVPSKCTLEGDANEGKYGLYDLVTGTFKTDSLGTSSKDYTPGDNVYGLKLSASASYDQSKNKAEVSFTAVQGEADVYVTITNILTGGAETTYLSREKAKKGDEWVHELDASSFSDGDTIGYRTVTNTVESFTIRTMTVTPAGSVSFVTKTDTNATLSATSTFVGDFSTSVDVYLAYAANGAELPEPTLAHVGVAVNTPVSLVLSNLLAETAYNYRVVFKNSQNGECVQSGSVTTYPVMRQPVDDPDPTYTPGYTKFLNLPAEYTQLESLTSDGYGKTGNNGQIVNTGIKSSNSISVELDFSPAYNHGATDFGHNSVSGSGGDYRFASYGSGTFFDMGNSRAGGPNDKSAPVMTPGKRYNVWMGALNGFAAYTIYNADGTLLGSATSSSLAAAGSSDMAAFGGFLAGGAYSLQSMTIWSIVIRDSGTLVGDFVPVMRNSDSEYGLYNQVSKTFCPSVTGTGFNSSIQGAAVPGVGVDASVNYTNGHWRISLEVVSGTGDIYATSDDGNGNTKRILLMPEAKVGDSTTYDFDYLTEGNFYTFGYLAAFKDGDTTVKQYTSLKSVFNGTVTLSPTKDADEGKGVIGEFTIALANEVTAASALTVAYTVEDSSTAVAGQTYAALSGTVTIPAGASSATIKVVPLPDETTAEDTTVVLKLAAGAYLVGTTSAQSVTVKNGASFGGWIYDSENGRIYDSDWQFIATDLGSSKLKIGNVNGDNSKGKVVMTLTPLDFSKVVVSSDGTVWTITETECCFATSYDSVLISAPYVSALTLPPAITRVGKNSFYGLVNAEGELTLPSTIVTIEQRAFYNMQKMTLDAADFPQDLLTLGHCAFHDFTHFTGDLNLPKVVADLMVETFRNTGLTSIHFGPYVKQLNGYSGQGVCRNCTSLTNITFTGQTSVIGSCNFQDCTSLKELNWSTVPKLTDCNFAGSSLERIAFGTNLVNLSSNVFQNATHLQTIVFEGLPPTTFASDDAPYLWGVDANQKVTTYIHKANRATENAGNKCWLDYSANNSIMHTHTTFGSSFIVEGVDPAMRPLVTIEPTPGLKLIVR